MLVKREKRRTLPLMTRRSALWMLALIIGVGVGLRTYHLTARSIWFDESFSWRLVQFPWSEVISRTAADAHPPLYYLVLKTWANVFGNSLFALRSLSVALAGISLALVYGLTSSAARSRE